MSEFVKTLEILGEKIELGESKTVDFNIAKLFTSTNIAIPVIIERSLIPGPTILITAAIHGDEINGVEIVRQLIARKINKPKRGSIICIPILNVFGFLNTERAFPDGRDLNRVFPGNKRGSLASRVAYYLTTQVLPLVDYCMDFHTGGASRFNAPQVRVNPGDENLLKLAKVFNVPFIVYSKNLKKSYRATCNKLGIPIVLFEGGKSLESNTQIVNYGVRGIKRFLYFLDMLDSKFNVTNPIKDSVIIEKSRWIRAQKSGLFHLNIKCSKWVEKGEILATITDPYGKMTFNVIATNEGFIINVNQTPIVHQGDAIFHISTK
jgi:hypothetical protein